MKFLQYTESSIYCFVMLPKVDYVLITSLFVCRNMDYEMMAVWSYMNYETAAALSVNYEVIVCNGTVWQRTVPFLF